MRPVFVRAALGCALTVILSGCNTTTPVETLRTRGDHSFRLGAYDQAAEDYREITARYPGDWNAQYQLGLCELKAGHYASALRALRVTLDRKPERQDVADALAEALYLNGVNGAQADLNPLFTFLTDRARGEQTTHAWLRLGRYAMRTSDPDLARLSIDTAIAVDIDPTGDSDILPSIEPYLEAANLAEELGDTEEQIRRLRQAYGLDPHHEQVNRQLRDLGQIPGPSLALPPGR